MTDTSYIENALAGAIETLRSRRAEVVESLRPLQDELAQIDAALERLTGATPTAAKRTSRGSNAEKIKTALAQGPLRGADLAKETGVPGIYAYLSKLVASGEITKHEDGRYGLTS